MMREMSEDGGYFMSDNFTSNETSYLHIVDKLRELNVTGGAYIGVGPEQNFTYIAKIRPKFAFIIDIRRQAVIQHLMYKAIFTLSPARRDFLSLLLSKPVGKDAPKADASLNDLLAYFGKAPTDTKVYESNLATIRKTIQNDFQFPLSENDVQSLEYVYKSFKEDGLEIKYRVEGNWGNQFPSLGEILACTDLNNVQGNFLVSNDDYEFVRGMHKKNLIVPVVGDFGGSKALTGIAEYLKKIGLPVSAYYTSNVEQYLFSNDVFAAFARNVKKLPTTPNSVFIRAVAGRGQHPARIISGNQFFRLFTILQKIEVFEKDFDENKYLSYWDLVTTNYIMANKPQ
mgnify:CR=1 FL=1